MLEPFDQEKYLNLESYRRNRVGVRTPIWFARNGERLYAYSWERSGKVKRIRNSPRVRIVPCSARGDPRGEWIEARARIAGPEEEKLGLALLDRKYGWQKRIVGLFSRLQRHRPAVIAIELP